ncbi:hypothetical protein PG988_011906 [Apiospora saccharicola]
MKTYGKQRRKRHRPPPWAAKSTVDTQGALDIDDSEEEERLHDPPDSSHHSDDEANPVTADDTDQSPRGPRFVTNRRRTIISSPIQDTQMDIDDHGDNGSDNSSEEPEESDEDDVPDPSPPPPHARAPVIRPTQSSEKYADTLRELGECREEVGKLHQKSQETLEQRLYDPDLWKRIKHSEAFLKVEKDRLVSFKDQVAESMPDIKSKCDQFQAVGMQADSLLRLAKREPERLPAGLIEKLLQLNVYALGSLDWVRQLGDEAKKALFNDELERERVNGGRTGPVTMPPPTLPPPESAGGIDFSQAAIMSKEEALFRQKYLDCDVERHQLSEKLASTTLDGKSLRGQVAALQAEVKRAQRDEEKASETRKELEKYAHDLEGQVDKAETLLRSSKKEEEHLRDEISQMKSVCEDHQHEYELVCFKYEQEKEAHNEAKKGLRGTNHNLSFEVQGIQFQRDQAEEKLKAEEGITAKLKEQLREARAKVQSSSEAASKLRSEKIDHESRENSLNEHIRALESDAQIQTKKAGNLEEELKARDKKVKDSEDALSSVKSELLATQSSLKAKTTTAEEDRSTIKTLDSRISRGASLIATLQKDLRQREEEVREAKRLADEQTSSKEKQIEKNDMLAKDLASANGRIEELETDMNGLQGTAELLTEWRTKAARLQHLLETRQQELESAQSLAEGFNDQFWELESYKTRLANAQETASTRLQELESARSLDTEKSLELQKATEELIDLRPKATELATCRTRVCSLEEALNEATEELIDLRPKATELATCRTRVCSLEDALNEATEELIDLRPKATELVACKTRVCSLEEGLKGATEKLQAAESRGEAQTLELQRVQSQYDDLRPKAENLGAQVTSLEAERTQNRQKIDELEEASKEGANRESALKKDLRMARQSVSDTEKTAESDKASHARGLREKEQRVGNLESALRQKEEEISEVRAELDHTNTAKTEAEKTSVVTKAVLNTLETATSAWFEGRFGELPGAGWKKFAMMWDPNRPAPSRGNRATTETVIPWTVGAPWMMECLTEPPDFSCLHDRVARLYWLVLSQNNWDLGDMSLALELLASVTKDVERGTASGNSVAHLLRAVRDPFLRKLSPAMHLRGLAAFALRELADVVGIEFAADRDSKGTMLLPMAIEEAIRHCGRQNTAGIREHLLACLPGQLRVVGDLGICKEDGQNFMVAIDFSRRVIWVVDMSRAQEIRNFPYSELVVESPDARRGQDLVWHDPGMEYELWWTEKLLPPGEMDIEDMESYVPLFS